MLSSAVKTGSTMGHTSSSLCPPFLLQFVAFLLLLYLLLFHLDLMLLLDAMRLESTMVYTMVCTMVYMVFEEEQNYEVE